MGINDTTWRMEIDEALEANNDTLVYVTLSDQELDRVFDAGHGREQGQAFTAWGVKYVYFPIKYDGAEWVGCAPRNPVNEPMEHQGGG